MSVKRVLAGLLCASMVLSVAFTGCSNDQGSSSATSSGGDSSAASESESTDGEAITLQMILDADTVGIAEPAKDILEEQT